ncbi:MAG TPA: efflux transporter outer membrane subunit, partial [Terriglobales bacterium]
KLKVPGQYRGAPTPTSQGQPFGEMQWDTVFQDHVLQGLVKEALNNNYDIQIAATRILEANANLGIVRANQFPTLNGSDNLLYTRSPINPSATFYNVASISLNYIVDFWGQYRRATQSARATLLATEYAHSVVQTTLISSVATNYFLLRQYDLQLEYSNDTVKADANILQLNIVKFKGGDTSQMDVYQAQVLLQQAQAQVFNYKQLVEQTENNLSILLGRNPDAITRGLSLSQQPQVAQIPAGLPSALLERRPDVRSAEENLVAANANVGVAKAAFFPQIALTGQYGLSTAITGFLAGPAPFWAVGGQIVQPIFEGGRLKSSYRLAWAERDEAELIYKQTVLNAFGDVSNSLVGYYQARQFRMKVEEQTKTYKDAANLANVRFRGGVTSFLEVLIIEQDYFASQLTLATAWYSELANYVQLYQALGGGWQPY